MKNLISFFLAIAMILCASSSVFAADGNGVSAHIDSVNGTRWADYICVYKDRPTTEQNEWGENIVVDSEGKVIEKIPGGDISGRNLAIPQDGMIVSGTGDIGKELYAAVDIGDNAYFDEYGMRVLFSKGEIDPFYSTTLEFHAFNEVRYSNTVVVYNKSGEKTGTNGFGYEAAVNSDGVVISAGGNDTTVPDGGFVVSAIESEDINFLKSYFIPGAFCKINGKTLEIKYTPEMLNITVANEIKGAENEIQTAIKEFRLVDTDSAKTELENLKVQTASSLEERDGLIDRIKEIKISLIEKKKVDIRSTWYEPLERSAEEIEKTVKKMSELGINQLCLGVSSGHNTIVEMPDDMPFKSAVYLRRVDMIGEYIKYCEIYDIELILSVSLFHGTRADSLHPEWLTHTNEAVNSNKDFYSPANKEYIDYLKKYVKHIVTTYDVDGIQWDYIRYPYFDGKIDYGYDDATKKLFAEKTGLPEKTVAEIAKQLYSHEHWETWVDFKIGLIDDCVKQLSEVVRENRPDLYISACLADDTGYGTYCQDGSTWLENNWVDGIYPMSYAEGIMGSATKKFGEFITDSTYLVMGNGAYLSLTIDEMYRQITEISSNGGDGIGFFEWGAYVSHQYGSKFVSDIYKDKAVSFTFKESESVRLLLESAKARFQKYFGETELFNDIGEASDLKYALLQKYDYNEHLYKDIDLALRIQKFSKEDKRNPDGNVSVAPEESGEEISDEKSEHESITDSTPEESSTADKTKSKASLWIAGAVGILAVAATLIFIIKRRKQQ